MVRSFAFFLLDDIPSRFDVLSNYPLKKMDRKRSRANEERERERERKRETERERERVYKKILTLFSACCRPGFDSNLEGESSFGSWMPSLRSGEF